MKLLPIAGRELRVIARRNSTYWLRFTLPAALLFIATWIFLLASRQGSEQTTAIAIYYLVTGGLTFFAFTAGLRATADSLSEEKREGTLGLLFLTDLRGYDVVVGKLLANSLAMFYAVVAVLPLLAVPLLVGGVTGLEVIRLAAVIVNTLFFSLSAGMLASALGREARTATALTLLLLLMGAGLTPALGLLEWKLRFWRGDYREFFLWPCPAYTYAMGLDSLFRGWRALSYFASLATVHGLGWLFLGLASYFVKSRWQDKPAAARREKREGAWQEFWEGDAHARRDRCRSQLDVNAYYWLAARPPQKAIWAWLPLGLAAAIWGWGYAKFRADWLEPGIYVTTAFLLALVYKAYVGAEAGARIREDRKLGALELLLSTPLSVREIIHGQCLALWRQFGRPIGVTLATALILLVAGLHDSQLSGSEQVVWLWWWLGGIVVFLADLVALRWLGFWLGLAASHPRQAFGAALAPILALPWLGVAVVMSIGAFLPGELRTALRWDYWPGWLWFGFSLGIDAAAILYSRHKLNTEFRLRAAQRFQPRRTWWQRWLGNTPAATVHDS